MTTSYIDVAFPDAVARGATGGPKFLTDIVSLGSGAEQRNIRWAQRRAEYNISTGIRTRTQMNDVIAHFHNMCGRAYSFPFKDWSDYSATDMTMVEVSSTVWQLVKRYARGTNVYVRTITKPKSGTVVVKVDDEEVTPSDIDTLTGQVTFSSAPSVAPTASFQFYVPVRFDDDHLPIQVDTDNKMVVSEINLVEVRDE